MAAASSTKELNVKEYPALCAFFRLKEQLQVGQKRIDELRKKVWTRMSIDYDDWMAPYFIQNNVQRRDKGEKPYCTFFNHRSGHGCNKEGCKFEHRCMVCQEEGHGAFFPTKTNFFRCPIVRQQHAEIIKLEESGYTEQQLHEAWNQCNKQLLFESQIGTTVFRYEKSQVVVSGFPRKADFHVYKAPSELIKKKMHAKGISNGGLLVMPAEEKKNALVFVLYY